MSSSSKKSSSSKRRDRSRSREKERSKKHRHTKHKRDKHRDRDHETRKRHRSRSSSREFEPKHKKMKSNSSNNHRNPPPTTSLPQEMIDNAKTVLNMLIENDDDMKQYLTQIFATLDRDKQISMHDIDTPCRQPLQMIFTFLGLHSKDEMAFEKRNSDMSILSLFKAELRLQQQQQPKSHKSSSSPTSAIPAATSSTTTSTFIGPAPPPPANSKSATCASKQPNAMIGPTMPSASDLQNRKNYTSDEDEDEHEAYGPARPNTGDAQRRLQMQHTRIYVEMEQEISAQSKDANESAESTIQRPEWLTSMPESFMSTDFVRGTQQRGFQQLNNRKRRQGKSNEVDRSWEDTPLDIEHRREEKKRVHAIQQKTSAKLVAMGLPAVDEEQHNMDDDNADGQLQMENGKAETKKPLSLCEMHQQKLQQEYEDALLEWKTKKKKGQKVGPKPVFKGAKRDMNDSYSGSMDSFYHPQNPVLTTSQLRKFVDGGTID